MGKLFLPAAPAWLRWLLWLTFIAAWTTALLLPNPTSTLTLGSVQTAPRGVGKVIHVLAYAILTILAGWLHVPARFRWLGLFFIMAHAPATELLQDFVPPRTGRLGDVGLDHLGVAIGLVLSWKWWTAADRVRSSDQQEDQRAFEPAERRAQEDDEEDYDRR
jgi:VanZ family protein